MGLGDRIAERLEPEIVPPAPGQGAIAVQVRSDDERMLARGRGDRRPAHASRGRGRAGVPQRYPAEAAGPRSARSPPSPATSSTCSGATRARMAPGPRSPAVVVRSDPARISPASSPLNSTGGLEFGRFRATSPRDGERSSARRVLVTRAVDQAGELVSALRDAGLDPIAVPAIAIEFEPPRGDLDAAAGHLHTYRWVVDHERERGAGDPPGRRARPHRSRRTVLGGDRTGDAAGPRSRGHRGRAAAESEQRGSRWPSSSRSMPATGSSSSAAISPTRILRSPCAHGGPRSTT